jgi:hypothetical protein
MNYNAIRRVIQDRLKTLVESNTDYTVIFDGYVGQVDMPYALTRIDFGDSKRKDIGGSLHLYRGFGSIVINIINSPDFGVNKEDQLLQVLHSIYSGQEIPGILCLGFSVHSRKVDDGQVNILATISFQYDNVE